MVRFETTTKNINEELEKYITRTRKGELKGGGGGGGGVD